MKLNLTRLLRLDTMSLLLCAAHLAGFVTQALGVTSFPRRPFVLINQKELASLRADLAKPGWKADLYRSDRGLAVMSTGRGVRANADFWLKRPIKIPARGGHYHHFF